MTEQNRENRFLDETTTKTPYKHYVLRGQYQSFDLIDLLESWDYL